jgi:hypothetical protein
MASRRLETEIDRLYQQPLSEFTAARNTLARDAGAEASEIRQLAKPPLAAWAINQLYWKRREIYDALIKASQALRQTHKTILSGRRVDLREPTRDHEEAVDAALKAALAIIEEAGHPATDSTRQSVLTTLRALPSNQTAGRLTEVLQPGGFEMLQGLSIAGAAGVLKPKATPPVHIESARGTSRSSRPKPELSPEEAARAEARRAEATKALKEAEQAARREEFEASRLAREAEKATRQVERAREALRSAEQVLQEAEEATTEATQRRDAARLRAKETARALEAARRQHESLSKT